MEVDKELFEMFVEEINGLIPEFEEIVKSLGENPIQAEEYIKFSNLIDRIYGTALTLGFKEMGDYLGALKDTTRKCGTSGIQRAMPSTFTMIKNYLTYFSNIDSILTQPKFAALFYAKFEIEIKKANKLNEDVFAFSKDSKKVLD